MWMIFARENSIYLILKYFYSVLLFTNLNKISLVSKYFAIHFRYVLVTYMLGGDETPWTKPYFLAKPKKS